MWRRVVARKEAALDLLGQLRCTTATQLGRRLGISHLQAYYTLKMLEGEGKVSRYRAGRAHVWCASPVSSPTEAYAVISPCLRHIDRALARLIGGARGAIVTITPGDIIRTIELMFRVKCAAPLGRPHLLAAARAWLEGRLDGAVVDVVKRETKHVQFIIDVKKAKEKLLAVVA